MLFEEELLTVFTLQQQPIETFRVQVSLDFNLTKLFKAILVFTTTDTLSGVQVGLFANILNLLMHIPNAFSKVKDNISVS